MKLEYIDRMAIEKQVNEFINSGNNDYYEFSRNQLRKIFLNNPKQVIFIRPNGNIINCELKPSEHHYVAFLKYLDMFINEDNITFPNIKKYKELDFTGSNSEKNTCGNEIANILVDYNYVIIYSLLYQIDLIKTYIIKKPIKLFLEQEESLNYLKNELNLNDEFLITNDEYGENYRIPFENIVKTKTKQY